MAPSTLEVVSSWSSHVFNPDVPVSQSYASYTGYTVPTGYAVPGTGATVGIGETISNCHSRPGTV